MTYYTNDLAATVTTSGATTRAYGLDATGRIASWADTTGWVTAVTSRNHYDDTSDSPAWTDNGDNTWTRTVDSISGNLALTVTGTTTGPTTTTGALVDQHGDIVATLANTTGTNTVTTTTAYTEYGDQADGTTQPRYGWLGGKHRPTETTAGLILMGVRLYNTTTGRVLQTDPIPGGSAGPYLYPTNPITTYDLDGNSWSWLRRAAGGVGRWAVRNRGNISRWASWTALGVCVVASGGLCSVASGAMIAASAFKAYHDCTGCRRRDRWGAAGKAAA